MIEAMLALSILTVIGLVLLKLSLNILHPRQWTMQQSVSDAYMSFERASAERIPFETLLSATSLWPAFPATAATSVEIGRLPRYLPDFPTGVPITATVTRTRFPDAGNYPNDGGTAATAAEAVARNPAAMKIWKVQSVLTYRIGAHTYAKSRTVLRCQ